MTLITPCAADFVRLASEHEGQAVSIPVYREVLADLDTPVSAFMKVCDGQAPLDRDDAHAFLLESVEGGERWARYSVIGFDPAFVVRAHGRSCEVLRDGWVHRTEERDDPLGFLQDELARTISVQVEGLPAVVGAAVGWLAWDAVRWWERLPSPHPVEADAAPTLVFAQPRSLLVFDNLRHRIAVVQVVAVPAGSDPRVAHAGAVQRIDRIIGKLRGPLPERPSRRGTQVSLEPEFDQPAFEAGVARIQEYIRAGDCIQVVLSNRFKLGFSGHPLDLYRALRAVNPSPYMFHLRYPEQLVTGASPEVMVRVADDTAWVSPIAGTRHRGANEAEDLALAEDLLADPKEVAEHVMLVDLARNDLGRVAAPGSVSVDALMKIERYSHVMHIVSDVRAQLAEGLDGFDAVRATFPAGTLSGAPKVRAMAIIDELEPVPRGPYGGAVGWVRGDGQLDLAIAIRTAWRQGDRWFLQVGAGIVADSVPSSEYQETLNKGGAVLRALELAERGL